MASSRSSDNLPLDGASSIVEVLKRRATANPTRPVFTFLHNGEVALESLTFSALDGRAERFAAILRQAVGRAERFAAILRQAVGPGSRVILMLPAGYAFIEALFGCFYAGCIAVPAALPRRRSTEFPLVEKIVRDSDAAALVTTAELSRTLQNVDGAANLRVNTIRQILVEEVARDITVEPTPTFAMPEPSALAHLQYTSGSTGEPRGVMVRHANILAAVRSSAKAFAIGEDSRFVSWLPHYHDMGLVGSLLQTIYCGAQCWFMSPQAFIAKPDRWLAAITSVGATISGGPDFAYGLCTRAAHRAHEFRLQTWQCAYNGSEPVRFETLQKFVTAFADSGFRLESFRPSYGLAEATLQVSGGPIGRAPAVRRVSHDSTAGTPREHVSVSCGHPVEGADIRIVDPESLAPVREGAVGEIWVQGADVRIVDPESLAPVREGAVGEIWVHAPQVGGGYWGKPGVSREIFEARIAGESSDTAYLRTGDAGMFADGELFVLGRYRDTIILNGVNHQPEPIEATVAAAGTALRIGTSAAISVLIDGRERLVVVAESTARSPRQLTNVADVFRNLRAAIHRAHDLGVHTLALVPQFSLPRTTSGKVRRHKVRELFLSDQLDVLHLDTTVSGKVARNQPGDATDQQKRTA